MNDLNGDATRTPSLAEALQRVQDLRRQGGIFVEAVRLTRMPILVTDPTLAGNPIIFANEAFLALSGYDEAEVLGRSPEFLNDSTNDRDALQLLDAALQGTHRQPVELVQRRKDGSTFVALVAAKPVTDAEGRIIHHFFSFIDVSDHSTESKARRQADERYRLLVEGVTDYAIYMLDPAGYITSWNTGAQRIKGYTADEIIGQHFSRFFTEEDRASGAPQRALAIAERDGRFECEARRVRKDGSLLLANVVIDAIRDDSGALVGFAKVTRDMTERARLETARRSAEDASRAKTEFLASMSHEIRTPLNGIIGYTDVLLDQDLRPEQRRIVERIQFAGSALLTVVNDILDFSKIEAGQITVHAQPFSPRSLLDNTFSVMAEVAERKGLSLEMDVDPAVPDTVVGDEARIRQVLLNLLNNAVKFTFEGRVTLTVQPDNSSDGSDFIRFEVTDTGIGIPEEQRKRLFHRFHQVDHSSTRQFGGTGLGLAISKSLIEFMAGDIGLQSEEGKGSTFWFKVPLPRAPESTLIPAVAEPAETQSTSGRILLVEDLEHNRDLARMILQKAGHEVDVATNGAEAVAAVQAKTYDLILMDVQMPVMNGITATKKIRELDHPASRIPIIAMTANVLPHQVKGFAEAGMNDHVGKPFKRQELFHKVSAWLQRSIIAEQPSNEADATLQELKELMGAEWVASGLQKLRQQIEEIFGEPDVSLADPTQLASRAHALVSHASLLEFNELSKACRELEQACANGADLSKPFQHANAVAQRADARAAVNAH